MKWISAAAFVTTMCVTTAAIGAQATPNPGPDAQTQQVRVFLDCQTMGCDRDFFQTEITFVDWTRDRADAEVHLLVTARETGSGGLQYTTQFIGLKRFASHADTIVTTVPPNSTDDDRRRTLARTFTHVLVRYATTTSAASRLNVVYTAPAAAAATVKTRDPWNLWVFRASGNGFFNGESQAKSANLHGNLSASRTTAELKVSIGATMSYNESRYTFDDGSKSTYIQRSSGATFRMVRSMTDHWSAGLSANAGHSEYNNQDFFGAARASVEYNFFPWKESTQHQFVAIYAIGPTYNRYVEETIYFKHTETLPQHQLILANETKERWGSVDLSASFSQYLQDVSKTNASLGGSVDVRLFKGLSVNIGGSVSSVHDQLYLARGSLSPGEVLTRQRALATSFSYFSFVGLSYTFGSIYNTIVNPRLDKISGGQSFMFSFN